MYTLKTLAFVTLCTTCLQSDTIGQSIHAQPIGTQNKVAMSTDKEHYMSDGLRDTIPIIANINHPTAIEIDSYYVGHSLEASQFIHQKAIINSYLLLKDEPIFKEMNPLEKVIIRDLFLRK